ncbi:MAG TPA: hypothetical protein VFV23_05210 [Verrucomicrobiae bacterium]|nr:hypothetical protein [Verrucomicrobiae bacterium]
MGRTFHFECPHCRYRARVSGGADSGLNCVTQTIFCYDCRELFDVFVSIRKRENGNGESNSNYRSKLLPMKSSIPPAMLMENPWPEFKPSRPRKPARKTFWENVKIQCPVSAIHRVERWHDPGRCPRCGNFLEKNVFPYRLWE